MEMVGYVGFFAWECDVARSPSRSADDMYHTLITQIGEAGGFQVWILQQRGGYYVEMRPKGWYDAGLYLRALLFHLCRLIQNSGGTVIWEECHVVYEKTPTPEGRTA